MAREISLLHHPIIEPGVCAKCGTQHASWFVDLGIDSIFNYVDDNNMKTWTDGIVYFCCDCINSLASDLFRAYQIYKREESRELDPLKLTPITIDKKEVSDGDSGPGSRDDSGDSEGIDEEPTVDELDDAIAVESFNLTLNASV